MDIVLKACDRCDPPAPGEVPERTSEAVFDHEGQRWVLDLCSGHEKEFQRVLEALHAYTESARKVVGPKAVTATGKGAKQPKPQSAIQKAHEENERIRQWAIDNKYEVAMKGRISAGLKRLYDEAMKGNTTGQQAATG